MLLALADGRSLPAGRLAAEAEVSAATASSHLHKLTADGLLVVEATGRRRNYRIADPEVATLIEALERLAPTLPVRSLQQSQQVRAWRQARVCYDHIAGTLGVELMGAMVPRRHLEPAGRTSNPAGRDSRYRLTDEGRAFLDDLGVTVPPPRQPIRHHADSTEDAPHLSGALGRALLARFVALGWVQRLERQRLRITPEGHAGFEQSFGVRLDD
jgi:predicted transcriptional regulator